MAQSDAKVSLKISPRKIIQSKIMPLLYKSAQLKTLPSVEVAIETKKFLIKIAHGKKERQQSHDLRLKVFASEYIGNSTGLLSDWDWYDKKADFLVIIDKEINEVVGSYRLIRSRQAKKFYTSSEFFINSFISSPGVKVELSRACVAPEYRKGSVVLLLWKGIQNYLAQVNADTLFGCSSLSNISPEAVLEVIRYLDIKGYTCDNTWGIRPKNQFDCNQLLLSQVSKLEPTIPSALKLPPLFKSYLKIGAKMISVPAYDAHYKCYDFFTILKVEDLTKIVYRKFFK